MSVFYDEASLVVVPSGYKSGKIYAQKPLTTDGQLTFTRASTATRVNASGLIEAVATGVPRLDYLNSTCPRLLLEPQRTNLVQYSEQFDNAYFSKADTAVNANVATSPDGSTNADKLVATATTGTHYLGINVTSASPAVLSVFAKAGEETIFAIGNATGSAAVVFNLSTGTITSGTNGTIVNYGNGWYRCSYYRSSWTDFQYLSLRGNAPSYTGNGTDGIFLYGAQLEVGAYATSYIPTTTAAVTRLAETISKTLINSNSNFSFFLELDEAPLANGAGDWMALAPSGLTGRAFMYATLFGFADNFTLQTSVANQTKFAWTQLSSSTAKIFSNGVLRGTSTSGTYSNPYNLFSVTGTYLEKPVRIKQLIFFDAPISDAKAIELTTP